MEAENCVGMATSAKDREDEIRNHSFYMFTDETKSKKTFIQKHALSPDQWRGAESSIGDPPPIGEGEGGGGTDDDEELDAIGADGQGDDGELSATPAGLPAAEAQQASSTPATPSPSSSSEGLALRVSLAARSVARSVGNALSPSPARRQSRRKAKDIKRLNL